MTITFQVTAVPSMLPTLATATTTSLHLHPFTSKPQPTSPALYDGGYIASRSIGLYYSVPASAGADLERNGVW